MIRHTGGVVPIASREQHEARPDGQLVREERVEHDRGAFRHFLERCEPGSPVAVETVGNRYWIVDEIEAAGCRPKLVHARKARLMMGMINKTDKLDARGLNQLQRNGTLPTVWIPPGDLRDQRDLPRARMVLVRQRTQLKNRMHATLARYALHDPKVSDLFGTQSRDSFGSGSTSSRPHTAYATEQLLEQVEELDRRVRGFGQRMQTVFKVTPEIQLLMTVPGVGLILAVVIALEVGDVARFATAEKLTASAGTTPRAHTSGGKLASVGSVRTSTATSSGRSSKPPTPSASCADASRIATPVDSMSASPCAKATRRQSGRWPGIWPKRRIGSSASRNPYREPRPSAVSSTGDKHGLSMSSQKLGI